MPRGGGRRCAAGLRADSVAHEGGARHCRGHDSAKGAGGGGTNGVGDAVMGCGDGMRVGGGDAGGWRVSGAI